MGKLLVIKNADFSANAIETVTPPSGLTPLVYIKAGKTNVINTGVVPSSDIKTEMKCSADIFTSQFYGSRIAWNNKYGSFYGEGKVALAISADTLEVTVNNNKNFIIEVNPSGSAIIRDFNNNTLGSKQMSLTGLSIQYPMLMYGFSSDASGTPIDTSYLATIYYFKIWDNNGDLIHNFMPYLKDNAPIFRDTVTNIEYEFRGSDAIIYSTDGTNETTYNPT